MSIRKKTLAATTLVLGVPPAAMAIEMPPPSASGFAALRVSSTTAYAKAHGEPRRIQRPDCVEPVRGHYMCSYEGSRRRCRVASDAARWTPERPSLFTVTLAGGTRSCRSLQDALRSLR